MLGFDYFAKKTSSKTLEARTLLTSSIKARIFRSIHLLDLILNLLNLNLFLSSQDYCSGTSNERKVSNVIARK